PPILLALLDLVLGHVGGYFLFFRINRDIIAFFQKGNRAAILRFRCDMPDDKPVGPAGKTPVSKKGYFFTHAFSDQQTGNRKHLRHTGTSFWSDIADNHHIAFLDFILSDSIGRFLFGIKYTRRSGMPFYFDA